MIPLLMVLACGGDEGPPSVADVLASTEAPDDGVLRRLGEAREEPEPPLEPTTWAVDGERLYVGDALGRVVAYRLDPGDLILVGRFDGSVSDIEPGSPRVVETQAGTWTWTDDGEIAPHEGDAPDLDGEHLVGASDRWLLSHVRSAGPDPAEPHGWTLRRPGGGIVGTLPTERSNDSEQAARPEFAGVDAASPWVSQGPVIRRYDGLTEQVRVEVELQQAPPRCVVGELRPAGVGFVARLRDRAWRPGPCERLFAVFDHAGTWQRNIDVTTWEGARRTGLVFDPTGTQLLSMDADAHGTVWTVRDGRARHQLDLSAFASYPAEREALKVAFADVETVVLYKSMDVAWSWSADASPWKRQEGAYGAVLQRSGEMVHRWQLSPLDVFEDLPLQVEWSDEAVLSDDGEDLLLRARGKLVDGMEQRAAVVKTRTGLVSRTVRIPEDVEEDVLGSDASFLPDGRFRVGTGVVKKKRGGVVDWFYAEARAVSPDGRQIVREDELGAIHVTGRDSESPSRTLFEDGAGRDGPFSFTDDGSRVLYIEGDTLWAWSVDGGEPVTRPLPHPGVWAVSHDGSVLATASPGDAIVLHDLR